jgi:hypothetical protein
MVDLGGYLLGVVQLALVVGPIAFSAYKLRQRLLPAWEGAPARLVESIAAIALLIWISEILGTFGLFYAGTLVAASVLLGLALWFLPGGGDDAGPSPIGEGDVSETGPAGPEALVPLLAMVAVIAATVFSYAVTTQHALDRGIFNFDSLWYHMPFAVEMVQSHSVTGMHHTDTIFTNWFYPQNSELLHGVGILLTGRDTLSLFLNFGWLAIAFLAAYCVGRPYGRGAVTAIAAAILLECHTLVVRDPGAAKNDLMAAALILGAQKVRRTLRSLCGTKVRRTFCRVGSVGSRGGGPGCGARCRDASHGSGDGGGADGRCGRAGAAGATLGGCGLVVSAGACRRGLLVLAQPPRRRQPDPGGRVPGAGLAVASRAAAGRTAGLRHRPLRDRHRRLARVLRAGPA